MKQVIGQRARGRSFNIPVKARRAVPVAKRGFGLLAGYEERLADLGARAHWGQYNTLTAGRLRTRSARRQDWLEIEREFDSSGVFDSPFSKRVGI